MSNNYFGMGCCSSIYEYFAFVMSRVDLLIMTGACSWSSDRRGAIRSVLSSSQANVCGEGGEMEWLSRMAS